MLETQFPSKAEWAAYLQNVEKDRFADGCNTVVDFPQNGEVYSMRGFANCPAVVGIGEGKLWLLHHHFEERLKDALPIAPNIPLSAVHVFGVNGDRLFFAKKWLSKLGSHRISTHLFSNPNLMSELTISCEFGGIHFSFNDAFNKARKIDVFDKDILAVV